MTIDDKPHGRNLRIGRRSLPGQIYLITVVTEGRLPLFADFALGRLVVQSLHYVHQNGRAATLAFVVMPDHFHWLMQLANNETLPRVIRSLKTHTAREINRKHDARGALWQAGYHDHGVRQEEDLREIARYLIANPCAPESYPLSAITRCGTRCGCGAPMIGVRVLAIGNNRGRDDAKDGVGRSRRELAVEAAPTIQRRKLNSDNPCTRVNVCCAASSDSICRFRRLAASA